VHKGLDRDRSRRYATLAELRAEIAVLVPEGLTFGGLGVRIAAYLTDEFLVRCAALPVAAGLNAFVFERNWNVLVTMVAIPAYFIVLEGRGGRSLGKRLFGLRVCTQGTTDPPGLMRAAIRTAIFFFLFILTVSQVRFFLDKIESDRALNATMSNLLPFLAGLTLLIAPMRRSNDYRGLHEQLSGTCVRRRPQITRPLRLQSQRNDRLEELPFRAAAFPATLGNYAIQRAKPVENGWVALGTDPLLSRRILFRLDAESSPTVLKPAESRPTRLWALGSGTTTVAGQPHRWTAYVAPAGAPLKDVVGPDSVVRWPEARPILRGILEELAVSQREQSLSDRLSPDQFWVQPDGKWQLVDGPLGIDPVVPRTDWFRQITTTLLEGAPPESADDRSGTDRIRAPLPVHVNGWTRQLFDPKATPESLARTLDATSHRSSRVTHIGRFTQLIILLFCVGPGLLLMWEYAVFYRTNQIFNVDEYPERAMRLQGANRLLGEIRNDPETLARNTAPEYAIAAKDPDFPRRLQAAYDREWDVFSSQLPPMNQLERLAFRGWSDLLGIAVSREEILRFAEEEPLPPLPPLEDMESSTIGALMLIPAFWGLCAFLFRGSLSYWLTGHALQNVRGGPAKRWKCLLRSLAVWLPLSLLLSASVVALVDGFTVALTLWLIAGGLMLAMPPLALWNPERGPHDRLLGTWLVPR
jgi:eukaryotic-like serine/threonine-protein kinase